jgi:hypothetical protein
MRASLGLHRLVAMRFAAIAAALVLFSTPLAVAAQQPAKVYRIRILADRAADSNEILSGQTFRDGLSEHMSGPGIMRYRRGGALYQGVELRSRTDALRVTAAFGDLDRPRAVIEVHLMRGSS